MPELKLHFIVDMDEIGAQYSPPLGIGYISAYLKKNSNNVSISLSYLSDNIMEDIIKIKPDIIGFSSTSRHFTSFRTLSNELKESFNIPIIWGGVHVSIAPQELPESAEVGVLGEGEETLKELLSHFRDGEFTDLDSIKGIVYRKDGINVVTVKRPLIEQLDSIPHPDLDLLRVKWDSSHRAVLMTSRGCPYKCRFCASSMFWDRTRLHSAEYVVAEIIELVGHYNVKEILIYDDFFTIDKKRVAKISELLAGELKLKELKFECLSRVDNFTEVLAIKLKAMGVYRISFGIESGCQKTLNYLKNEKVKLEQVELAIKIAKKYGIDSVGSFVIGSPFETAAEIEETFSFIEKLDLTAVQITIATPFPGTELWEDGKKIGKISSDVWSDDYFVLSACSHDTKASDILQGKKLLTQIAEEEFVLLVDKALNIQNKTNLTWKFWVRFYVRKFIIVIGLEPLLKLRRQFLKMD